jgi:16S rRNA (uracil1498-N3)-methyltransferase
MTRKCFLVEDVITEGATVTLPVEVAHHVRRVLRLRTGESVELRDGRGNGWSGVIEGMKGPRVNVVVGERQTVERESPLTLTLALAFSRSDRMELALRQATEMGVHRFAAFPSDRSDYRLPEAQLEKRKERWGKIAREALCQCGRTLLPEICIFKDTAGFIAHCTAQGTSEGGDLRIVAREEAQRQSLASLSEACPVCRRVLVLVGPEGGWSKSEGERFMEAGFHAVHLGPRVLRLETAVVAVLAAVQLLWGDIGKKVLGY